MSPNIFPDRFRHALNIRRISQAEFSRRTGIHTVTIQYLTCGKSHPRADTLYLIAKTLDVSADWLLGLSDVMERR